MAAKAKSNLTFVLGGTRSGKSAYAVSLGNELPGPRHLLPTAEPIDQDMVRRIAAHRASRGTEWITHETGGDLLGAIASIPPKQTILVDCMTLWLTRTILEGRLPVSEAIDELVERLKARGGHRIVVSSEVGLGIVPDDALARSFRDHAGEMNRKLAVVADNVVLVVAGLPVQVK